jgi:hypothetical protein
MGEVMGEYATVKVEKRFLGIKYRRTEQLPHKLREPDDTIPCIDPELRIDVDLINIGDLLAAHRVIVRCGTTEEIPVPGAVIEGEVISVSARQVVLETNEGAHAVLPLGDYLDTELIHPPSTVIRDMEGPDAPTVNGRLPSELFSSRYAFYLMGQVVDIGSDALELMQADQDSD